MFGLTVATKYRPRLVTHTSCTHSLLSDLAVNRFQYAMTSGREMTRMLNEKMHMAPQTIFNWLKWGAEELKGGLKYIKKKYIRLSLRTSSSTEQSRKWSRSVNKRRYRYFHN